MIASERAEVAAFYETQLGGDVELAPDEEILIERDGADIVAGVRLVPEHGTLVLRTMVVADGARRRGVGTRLLDRAVLAIGERECYCIAWAYLERFYARGGFHPVAASALPMALRSRVDPTLVPLRREPTR